MNNTHKLLAGRRPRQNEACVADAYARGLWIHGTLADALQRAAEQSPQRALLIDGNVRLDCQTLCASAHVLARQMLAHAPSGSVVSFMLPNWHEAAIIYMAATMAGMVVNPILPSLRDRELKFILEDADCRLIFIPAAIRNQDYAAMLSRVVAGFSQPPRVVVLRGDPGPHTTFDAFMDAGETGDEMPTLDPDSVHMMMYTSGTTGRPKGVLHSHNTIHALIQQLGEHWMIDSGDKFLVPSPIAHIGGSIYAFECPLLLGTTAVLMERWNADEAVRQLGAEACTHMAGATPFLEQILATAERDGTRLPRLKVFICGGASVPPSLIRRARTYFERAVVTRVYGSTEVPVSTVGTVSSADADHAADTDGRAGLAEIKLAGHPAARPGEGEICVRGPQMLIGYLHPEDEGDAFDDQGFFRTGDLGRWVDEKYLVVSGRAKDIIIRHGENISPKEVEDILINHPDIAEIAIVGLPDERTGERACAVIVPKVPPGPDVAALRSFLDARGVAKFKAPEQVVIRDALPKNDAGKVLKNHLRTELAIISQTKREKP